MRRSLVQKFPPCSSSPWLSTYLIRPYPPLVRSVLVQQNVSPAPNSPLQVSSCHLAKLATSSTAFSLIPSPFYCSHSRHPFSFIFSPLICLLFTTPDLFTIIPISFPLSFTYRLSYVPSFPVSLFPFITERWREKKGGGNESSPLPVTPLTYPNSVLSLSNST